MNNDDEDNGWSEYTWKLFNLQISKAETAGFGAWIMFRNPYDNTLVLLGLDLWKTRWRLEIKTKPDAQRGFEDEGEK